jgi:hypothetical protein
LRVAFARFTRNITHAGAGAEEMSAEQVFRTAMANQMEGYRCERLAFHFLGSVSYRGTCRIGIPDKGSLSLPFETITAISLKKYVTINPFLVTHRNADTF